jgi:hypothetical protein
VQLLQCSANPKPQTPNPKHQTPNPKPQFTNQKILKLKKIKYLIGDFNMKLTFQLKWRS